MVNKIIHVRWLRFSMLDIRRVPETGVVVGGNDKGDVYTMGSLVRE